VNLVHSHFRRSRIERSYLRRARDGLTTDPMVDVILHDDLFQRLQGLPSRQRAAVVLRFCEDLSEEATAEALRTTAKAVNGLVNRGLATLRRTSKEGVNE
jgi:DNA-directed RNA polymerase specialized sigma24 family protein